MASIRAKDLSVSFPIGGGLRSVGRALVSSVGGAIGSSADGAVVHALKDLTFELNSGDRIGLIGHNGAGKSTLLQVLNGGIFPTAGTLETQGRIVPLLNLGNGSDPEFSGRENIFLLGMHLGLSRREIAEREAQIIEFTGLGDYIDLPLRSYSAGMHLRLMFSIATSLTPDILLIDELFGAGDQAFYDKAKARIEEMIAGAGILVFASHALGLISTYCNRVFVLDRGAIIFDGNPDEAVQVYASLSASA